MAVPVKAADDLAELVVAGCFQRARDVFCGEAGRRALKQAVRTWAQLAPITFDESATKLHKLPAYAQAHVIMFVIQAVVSGELRCEDIEVTDLIEHLNHGSQLLAPLPSQLAGALIKQCGCDVRKKAAQRRGSAELAAAPVGRSGASYSLLVPFL